MSLSISDPSFYLERIDKKRRWLSVLAVPELKDFPLKKCLYSISPTKRERKPKHLEVNVAKPISLARKAPNKAVRLSRIYSTIKNSVSTYIQSQTEIEPSSARLSDVERLLPLTRQSRLHSKRLSNYASPTSKDIEKSASLETSESMVGSRTFSFSDCIDLSDSRTQLVSTRKVREVVNLPKLPYGRHKNFGSSRFKSQFIRETLSTEWLNVNNSRRKSPKADSYLTHS